MTAFFISTEPVNYPLTDPETGDPATLDDGTPVTVSIRRLNAGDQVAIQNALALRLNTDGEVDSKVEVGTYRRLLVERLLVDWNLPLSLTPNTLDKLDPRIYDEIATLCSDQPVGANPTAPSS